MIAAPSRTDDAGVPPFPMRPLLVVAFTIFLDLLGFGLILPLQPLLAEKLGATGLGVGLLMTSYSAMQLVFAPVWGRISDRVGRKPVLLVSIAGSAASMLVFAMADSLPWLFAARAFAGLCNANLSTAQACVADLTAPTQRARGMGLVGMAFGMGFVLGPATGGALAGFGWRTPAFFAAGLAVLNLILAAFVLPETLPKERRLEAASNRVSRWEALRSSLAHPVLPWLFLTFLLSTTGFTQLEATFSLFTHKRFGYEVQANGWLLGFVGVVLAIVQGGLVGRLQKRYGEPKLLVAGVFLTGLGLAAMPLVHALPGLLGALFVLAVGNALSGVALSSLVSRAAPPDALGGVLGVNQSIGALGRIVGPIIAGVTFDSLGDGAPFLTGAVLLGLGVIAAVRATQILAAR